MDKNYSQGYSPFINWNGRERHEEVFGNHFVRIILTLFLSLFLGKCFLIDAYLPFLLFAFFVYLWLLFKYPEIALFISFLVIINCFSMISEDFLRLPNILRIRDLFFISIFIPLLCGIYRKDKKIKYIFSNPIAIGIYVILFLALIQIFITYLRFSSESFNSIIRTGRNYFYYAMFFPALYILVDNVRLKRFVKLFIGSAVIFCFLYIIQFFIGSNHKIFLWATVTEQDLRGFGVTRLYIDGYIVAALIFAISFMLYLFHNTFKYRRENIFIMFITGMQILVTFGRAHIFGIVMGILFGIFCAKGQQKMKSVLRIFIFLIVIIVTGSIVSLFLQKESIIQAIFERVSSTYEAVIGKQDTFSFRLEDFKGKIELIKRNPIFGIGFVHDESPLFAFARGYRGDLRTVDSGTITLLIDFGIIGMVWLFMMAIIVLKRSLGVYKKVNDQFYKLLILGIVAFYFSRLFSFITLADFVTFDGVVIIIISLVIIEVIYYQNLWKKSEQKRIIYNNC